MKPTSFVPTVGEISAEEAVGVPDLDAVISYWTDDGYTAEEWFRELTTAGGRPASPCGAAARFRGSWSTRRRSICRARPVPARGRR